MAKDFSSLPGSSWDKPGMWKGINKDLNSTQFQAIYRIWKKVKLCLKDIFIGNLTRLKTEYIHGLINCTSVSQKRPSCEITFSSFKAKLRRRRFKTQSIFIWQTWCLALNSEIINTFKYGPSGNPRRFEGNKINCFPRDQSLSNLLYSWKFIKPCCAVHCYPLTS